MAMIIDLAEAVANELNSSPGGTFSQDFTAVRRVLPEFELADLAELRVSVVPKAVGISNATRQASQYDLQIDIGVQKKLGKDLDTEVAVLAGFIEEVMSFLKRRPLSADPNAVWVKMENEPIYSPGHLAEQRVFTSVITLTYQILK